MAKETRGMRLQRAVLGAVTLDEHEAVLLEEAARCADRLDLLAAAIDEDGALLPDRRPHPALAESRQQAIALARLIAALRLPADLANPDARPQRRAGARGIYSNQRFKVVGG